MRRVNSVVDIYYVYQGLSSCKSEADLIRLQITC